MQVEPFLLRALAAGIGVAAVAGPIGCFVLWRRMAYFGDTMAHSALLGVVVGFLFSVNVMVGVIAITVTIALALVVLQNARPWLSSDALLGILSHASLSFGLVAIGLMSWVRIDLLSYLFGDILSVTNADVLAIWAGGAMVIAVLAAIWRPLLAASVHEDLARAGGIASFACYSPIHSPDRDRDRARDEAGRHPVDHVFTDYSGGDGEAILGWPGSNGVRRCGIGSFAIAAGLLGSMFLDTPAGPSIVVATALLFALSQLAFRGQLGRS